MAQTQHVSRNNTTVVDRIENGARHIEVTLHATKVFERVGNLVTLNSGGYTTATTKTRMNQCANEFCSSAFKVYQDKGSWYVNAGKGRTFEFFDGVQFRIL